MKLNEKVNNIKESIKSIRIKLFLTMSITITVVIIMLILINSAVLGRLYLYNKTKVVKELSEQVNLYYNNKLPYEEIAHNLRIMSINHNLDILIESEEDNIVYITDGKIDIQTNEKDFFSNIKSKSENIKSLYKNNNLEITTIDDKSTHISYIIAFSEFENGYKMYMRTPITGIQESVRISNKLLISLGVVTIAIVGIVSSVISKRFTKPIMELNSIARKMSNLDFSQKYRINDDEDEINNLGKSINTMSDKLESTINQLTAINTELERDIEKKSKIDEMRKQFISDVSHELKTPIALIQGYAEGLVEDVNTDDESRKFYADVILDEANKMDVIVKQLLELMKLEYGKRDFNNENFDVVLIISEVIKKCQVMLEENHIQIEFNSNNVIMVYADMFYVEQIITNYLTNAIKYSKEINDERKIEINIALNVENNKIRVSVFNTGDNLDENEMQRIWGRFYKVDSSRNRKNGGTGIGLAFVKAVMNNYKNEYGAINKENGIEFFFDLNMYNEEENAEEI